MAGSTGVDALDPGPEQWDELRDEWRLCCDK